MSGGVPPKPAHLRKIENGGRPLTGRFKARETSARALSQGAAPLGEPPASLGKAERAVWRALVARAPTGLLTGTDRGMLVSYCVTTVLRDQAQAAFEAGGRQLLVRSDDDRRTIANPYTKIVRQCNADLLAMSREIGLTPGSRNRVQITLPELQDDPLAKYFGAAPVRRERAR
jgi:P27 family predicted phage terminase small subunit